MTFTRLMRWSAMCLLAVLLAACSKSSDMEKLLEAVPSDAVFVMTINGQDAEKDFGVTAKDIMEMPEMKAMVEQVGKEKLEKAYKQMENSKKVGVLFVQKDGFTFSCLVEDGDELVRTMEKETGKTFTEKDGYKTSSEGMFGVLVKDNRLWMGIGLDVDGVERLLSLKKENRFATAHPEAAARMCEKGCLIAGFLNLKEAGQLAQAFAPQEYAQFSMAMEALYADPAGLLFTLRGAKDSLTLEALVLDKEDKPAECKLPLGSIDTGAMNKLDNTAMVVGAIGVPPELSQKVVAMISQFAGNDGEARQTLEIISKLSGTTSFCYDPAGNRGVVTVGMTDAQAATQGATLLEQMVPSTWRVSTAGNYAIARQGDAQASGTAPSDFAGKGAAVRIDFDNPSVKKELGYTGAVGSLFVYLQKEGKSCKIVATWQLKDFVRSAISLGAYCMKNIVAPSLAGPSYDDSDSLAVEEEAVEEEEAFVPEPDSDEDY